MWLWRKLLTALLALSLACLPQAGVFAHNGGTLQQTGVIAGQYRVWVWSAPNPLVTGIIHLTISVNLAVADQPVTSAQVVVTLATLADNRIVAQAPASTANATNKLFYEADLQVAQADSYLTKISISGDAGNAELQFPLTIGAGERTFWQKITQSPAGFLLAGSAVGVMIWAIWRRRQQV